MLKRIIIISLIYTLIILILTLNMGQLVNSYIFLITASSLLFMGLLFREIFVRKKEEFKQKPNTIVYTKFQKSELESLKKISTKPFLFGIEKYLVSDGEFYFDDANFYAINKDSQKTVYKLTDITELSKTLSPINNRRIWQVKIKTANNREVVFKFAHNYTIWNKNFPLFYKKIKSINPDVVKSKWNLWNV